MVAVEAILDSGYRTAFSYHMALYEFPNVEKYFQKSALEAFKEVKEVIVFDENIAIHHPVL